ncbi:group I intron-associated PD-(D/E)XK endonuclease [Haladaptatus salinisoli]|uniref:group I intron-associated PD-(D/E)XK endonuclease n=1 Tax=Haladaptatus salinisoli TaxID=2884876 RepID=UPI001D09EAB7
MNTSRKGDETEAVVLSRLVEVGLSVSVPFGDGERYDLVVDDGSQLYREQCKTGSRVNGAIRFNLYISTVSSEGRVDSDYAADEIDGYAVYSRRMDEVYWIPIEETRNGEMRSEWTSRNRRHRHRKLTGLTSTGLRRCLVDFWCLEST